MSQYFRSVIRRVRATLELRGDGENEYVTTHGLRATMVTHLIDAGYENSTITPTRDHKNNKSLRTHHNLRWKLDICQLERMLTAEGDCILENSITYFESRIYESRVVAFTIEVFIHRLMNYESEEGVLKNSLNYEGTEKNK